MKTHFLLFREDLKHKHFWKAVAEINNTLECWTCKKIKVPDIYHVTPD